MIRLRFLLVAFCAAIFGAILIPAGNARAALPELKIAPLRYDQHLELDHSKIGFIDASNPTGSTVRVKFEVQAFRQTGNSGALEYYDDARIAAAITPAVTEFNLGPREAIRTMVTIDPNRLGPGGAYGVVFLRTVPPAGNSDQTATSARVGTLFILDVGGQGTKTGRFTSLNVPWLSYGSGNITARYTYVNTGRTPRSLAFAPTLEATVGLSSASHKLTGPFVFPDRARQAKFSLPAGNHLGFVAVRLHDQTGSAPTVTRWVFMITGFWAWLLPLLCVLLFLPLSWIQRVTKIIGRRVPRLRK